MSLTLSSPEDVINDALARIGSRVRIDQIYQGTPASDLALDVYGQTRDELLRQGDWGFAERNIAATLLKSAPPGGYIPGVTDWNGTTYPPIEALFEYAYPTDCLKVRSVKPTPLFVPNFDPQPHSFRIANDNYYTTPRKVILCNVPNALVTYTGQVVDPTTWESDFTEALVAALGKRLAASLANLQEKQIEQRDEAVSTVVAEQQQG
jgi:hypothetical protein